METTIILKFSYCEISEIKFYKSTDWGEHLYVFIIDTPPHGLSI